MLRILVVADDPPTVTALTAAFRRQGCDVSSCAASAKAFDELKRSSFDVIVIDFEMGSKRGEEIVREVREYQPHACLMVVGCDTRLHHQDVVHAEACFVSDQSLDYASLVADVLACRARGGPGAQGTCHLRSQFANQL